LSNDGPERAAIELLVVWHYELGERIVTTQDDVASLLTLAVEAGLLQGLDATSSGKARQFAHTATSSASK